MKLIASLMVGPGEHDRYLEPCLDSLLSFCDEVRVRLERSPDDAEFRSIADRVLTQRGVMVLDVGESDFFRHEGRARQQLLDWTLEGEPTHVLSIDADEFVADGEAVRSSCRDEYQPVAWTLCMQEVWNADDEGLEIRQDGGWNEHDVPILWSPQKLYWPLRILDRPLACGREPEAVRTAVKGCADTAVLHFGWTRRAERKSRYDRYAVADGGKYHAGSHLFSILDPDSQVTLNRTPWPAGLEDQRAAILAYANAE